MTIVTKSTIHTSACVCMYVYEYVYAPPWCIDDGGVKMMTV